MKGAYSQKEAFYIVGTSIDSDGELHFSNERPTKINTKAGLKKLCTKLGSYFESFKSSEKEKNWESSLKEPTDEVTQI